MQTEVDSAIDFKSVTVACSKPRMNAKVEVFVSDTAGDVLRKAGLDPGQHVLLKPGDLADFGSAEPVFPEVSDQSKIHAVADCTVG